MSIFFKLITKRNQWAATYTKQYSALLIKMICMKAERLLFVLLFILLPFSGFAQQSGVEVRGTIIEEGNKEPIEQATVRLLNVKDSTMVGGVVSSRNGNFSIKNIKAGEYLLHVSYIGFDPVLQPLQITGRRNPVNVGRLEMTDGTVRLGEAVVIGKAAEVVVRNDTVEYNADSYKVTEGAVLEDLLKRMPGVEVDSEGKITINGKEISKILVDGKEFFSDDPKVASKNLPADMIDKIQTFEKRSDMATMTGFDDGDEENVINLTIKPGMKQGWFGNAFAGYGSDGRYEANAMVNRFINNDQLTIMGGINNTNNMGSSDLAGNTFSGMRGGAGGMRGGSGGAGNGITTSGNLGVNFNKEFKPNLSLNGNVRYTHSDRNAESINRTENILAADSSTFENERSRNDVIGNTVAANFRMEWKPDTLTTIIFRPNISYNMSENISNGHTHSYDMYGDSIYTINENYYSKGESYNVNAQLEYSRKLNNRGRVFSASLSGGYRDQYNDGDNYSFTEYYQRTQGVPTEEIDQQFRYENNGFNYRAYLSFVEPIGRNNFIQATYSFSQNKQEAIKNTFSPDANGIYNMLDSAYSQSYENNFITQRASISFRAQREKYNYLLGMNVDPSYSSSHTFVGDSTVSKLSRTVVNFSPMAQFNYLWDRRTNLRINYNGRTSQPSMTQLQPVQEVTSATNITTGNPDLKPTYTNNLMIRYQKFMPEQQRAFMLMANANYVINAIASKSEYLNDGSGKRMTTYENVNGNFNVNVRMMINSPLRNRKFSYSTMTYAGYNNSNGFVNADKNTSKNLSLQERLSFDFRSDYLDLGINGNVRYSDVKNTLQKQNDLTTWNYGVGGTTTIYLPWDLKVESDINYSANAGYSDGFNQKEVLWNTAASKSFLKNKQATLRFKIYDILQQRTNISRTVTANYVRDSEYNTLGSYFMAHFIYRFQIFSGGAGMGDMRGPRGGGFRGDGPGGPPPRF